MEIISGILGAVTIGWLVFREVAPKTPTKADDRVVKMVEDAFKKMGGKTNA